MSESNGTSSRAHIHKPCTVPGCSNIDVITRGMCPKHYQRWRHHGDPLKTSYAEPRKAGDGGFTAGGYHYKTTGKTRKYEHVRIAEAALGKPLPVGAQVHHVDVNSGNNSPSNLVICPDAEYHWLLHVRTRALDACGNANWRKCVLCKQYDDPSMMYGHAGQYVHRSCRNDRKAQRKLDRLCHQSAASNAKM